MTLMFKSGQENSLLSVLTGIGIKVFHRVRGKENYLPSFSVELFYSSDTTMNNSKI